KCAASWRSKSAPIIAIAGVAPRARNLSEMGIQDAPSSEPWIESNIWLMRAVADAAAAGGRWIVSLDDALRAKLRARDASALEAWRRLSSYLKFAESH